MLRDGWRGIGAPAVLVWCGLLILTGSQPGWGQGDQLLELERLEFKWEKPKTIVIYPGTGEGGDDTLGPGRIYWYLPYTLTNKGKESARFFVTVRAKSDKKKTYSDLALPKVEEKIERREQRKLFSKVDLLKGTDKDDPGYVEFAPGATTKCVAIFNPIDPEADTLTILVHGLVNDLKIENLGEGKFKIEEKVLQLTFKRPGDEIYPTLDRITFAGKRWITRETVTSSSGSDG